LAFQRGEDTWEAELGALIQAEHYALIHAALTKRHRGKK
jgi:hypothetical protein